MKTINYYSTIRSTPKLLQKEGLRLSTKKVQPIFCEGQAILGLSQ